MCEQVVDGLMSQYGYVTICRVCGASCMHPNPDGGGVFAEQHPPVCSGVSKPDVLIGFEPAKVTHTVHVDGEPKRFTEPLENYLRRKASA